MKMKKRAAGRKVETCYDDATQGMVGKGVAEKSIEAAEHKGANGKG
jgi:hypothetical protein